MDELMIRIDNVSKQYRLGAIGGGTLQGDLQSWWAKKRGKEDPNSKIGAKQYGKNEKFLALDGVSFEVKKGERVGIIGHNGAGKSTLLKLLSRVTAPTTGEINLNGRVASMLEVGTGFHGELTGRENIYMNGAILGMSKKEIDAKIEDIIEFSECRQFIDTPVKRYSSGMYVKLAFSVAAHLDSEIMIMDEVLAVGDMKFQQKCLGKMSDVSEGEGRTVLYVSHNMNTIRQLCTRCIVLDHGKMIFDGDVEEAISLYLGKARKEYLTKIDFRSITRDKPELGQKAELLFFELLQKAEPVYEIGEEIRFKFCWKAKIHGFRFKLFMPIRYADSTIVGTAVTDYLQEGENDISIDISELVEGDYSFTLALYAYNDFETETLCDHSIVKVCFSILNTHNHYGNWKNQWWGHICFPTR